MADEDLRRPTKPLPVPPDASNGNNNIKNKNDRSPSSTMRVLQKSLSSDATVVLKHADPASSASRLRSSLQMRRNSVDVEGTVGFSEMLDESGRLILDGERGNVTIALARWGFEARNATELSFPAGAQIKVLEQHVSGWWTGQYNGKSGFFPVNRTETQLLNLEQYMELQRRIFTTPMFVVAQDDDIPALPDPRVKAAKILGVSLDALDTAIVAGNGTATAGKVRHSAARGDRGAVMSHDIEEATSPRRAAASFSGAEEDPASAGTRRRGNSALSKLMDKIPIRKLGSPRLTGVQPPKESSPRHDEPQQPPPAKPSSPAVEHKKPLRFSKSANEEVDSWGDTPTTDATTDDSHLVY